MRDQLILLRETDWDALIILDACRADYFRDVCRWVAPSGRTPFRVNPGASPVAPGVSPVAPGVSPGVETVRSPGNCTPAWIAKVGPLLAQRQVLYFSANPVVDREIAKRGLALQGESLDIVPLWERLWSRLTHLSIPSVHPWAAVGAVLGRLEDLGPRACGAVVVHLLQPHSPYIGTVPLATGRWGPDRTEFGRACHGLARPDILARDGALDWNTLRRAYRANLALAWRAAMHLASQLTEHGRKVVITADHGELLGEDGGKFGHEANWHHPELYEVPWLELKAEGRRMKFTRQSCGGAEEDDARTNNEQRATKMLEALGYLS